MFRFSKIFFTKVLGDFFYFLFAKLQSLFYRLLLNNKSQASKFFNLILISIRFKKVPTKERQGVKFFVSYMSNTFKSVKNRFFKTSIHIVDRYHFIRQVSWALENVRKKIQKDISSKLIKYFKRIRSLLTKPASKLSSEEAKDVSLMLV
ncbi:transposase [Peptoniphilus harei]|uniref:transposase n=1 Tax=Peptoniphilus harei TaxID=54005 RepID=UPI00291C4E91|nr:transposase [Peptoniphilus harei]